MDDQVKEMVAIKNLSSTQTSNMSNNIHENSMLFLIEFLVKSFTLFPQNMNLENMDPCRLQGEVCIILNFLNFAPISICEKQLDPHKQTGSNEILFNCGKSIMFGLSNSEFINPPEFHLDITADKVLPHGCYPSKLVVGSTRISLQDLFRIVMDRVEDKPNKLPASKSIKQFYELTGSKNKCSAKFQLYIRLSCMGENIVTEFQRKEDIDDLHFFKNSESDQVYECKVKYEQNEELICPVLPGWGKRLPRDNEKNN